MTPGPAHSCGFNVLRANCNKLGLLLTTLKNSSSFTASLSDSAVDYPVEYGRRYHAFRPGTYPFPNDDLELQRLDLTHEMMVKGTEGKLFHSPINPQKTKRIMDIGTGTGIWAMVVADKFPDAEVGLSIVEDRQDSY